MKEINLKQKLWIGVIIVIVIMIAIYYFYTITKESNEDIWYQENKIEENTIVKENKVEENTIIIHITGEVVKPGVVELKEGSRVIDAIREAEGNKPEADLDNINLAYVLEDGQKICIPNKTQKEENEKNEYITTDSGNTSTANGSGTSTGKEKKLMININTATIQDLMQLPGIGESTANKIIEHRSENGKFNTIEDIKNVSGIGDAKFNNIKDNITVK